MNPTLKRLLTALKLRKPEPEPPTKQDWLSRTADRWHERARLEREVPAQKIGNTVTREMVDDSYWRAHRRAVVMDVLRMHIRVDMLVGSAWPVRKDATVWKPEPNQCNSSDSGSSCSASE